MANANPIEVVCKTFINGQEAKNYSTSQLYDLIAEQEAAIKKLEALENKPKKLLKEIEERKAGIQLLVDYIDA